MDFNSDNNDSIKDNIKGVDKFLNDLLSASSASSKRIEEAESKKLNSLPSPPHPYASDANWKYVPELSDEEDVLVFQHAKTSRMLFIADNGQRLVGLADSPTKNQSGITTEKELESFRFDEKSRLYKTGYQNPNLPSIRDINRSLASLVPSGIMPHRIEVVGDILKFYPKVKLIDGISDAVMMHHLAHQVLGSTGGSIPLPEYPDGFVYGRNNFFDNLVTTLVLSHAYISQLGRLSKKDIPTMDAYGALLFVQNSFSKGKIKEGLAAVDSLIGHRLRGTALYDPRLLQSVSAVDPYQIALITQQDTGLVHVKAYRALRGTIFARK